MSDKRHIQKGKTDKADASSRYNLRNVPARRSAGQQNVNKSSDEFSSDSEEDATQQEGTLTSHQDQKVDPQGGSQAEPPEEQGKSIDESHSKDSQSQAQGGQGGSASSPSEGSASASSNQPTQPTVPTRREDSSLRSVDQVSDHSSGSGKSMAGGHGDPSLRSVDQASRSRPNPGGHGDPSLRSVDQATRSKPTPIIKPTSGGQRDSALYAPLPESNLFAPRYRPEIYEERSYGLPGPEIFPHPVSGNDPSSSSRPYSGKGGSGGTKGRPFRLDIEDDGEAVHAKPKPGGPSVEVALLERLVQAIHQGGTKRKASSMDEVQANMLASFRAFNPDRDDIRSWTTGFKKLVPDDATDEQVLRTLECKLPDQYGDLLRKAFTEAQGQSQGWKEGLRIFLSRAAGGENEFLKIRKLKALVQKDGEPIRQFAIRVQNELRKARGQDPSEQEWKEQVIGGAAESTGMELDRICNQTLGITSFWDVIKIAEHWERQHAAHLHQGDPVSAIRRPSPGGAAVLLGEARAVEKESMIVCTWCSQRGHLESTCTREPRCAICFGDHPERNHGPRHSGFPASDSSGSARGNGEWYPSLPASESSGNIRGDGGWYSGFPASESSGSTRGNGKWHPNFPAGHSGNFRGNTRWHPSFPTNDPHVNIRGNGRHIDEKRGHMGPFNHRGFGRGQTRPPHRTRPPQGTPPGTAGGAAGRGMRGKIRCFACGQMGHRRIDCPNPRNEGEEKAKGQKAQANVASMIYPREPSPPRRPSHWPEDQRGLERESQEKPKTGPQENPHTDEVEKAVKVLLSNLKKKQEGWYDPFQ